MPTAQQPEPKCLDAETFIERLTKALPRAELPALCLVEVGNAERLTTTHGCRFSRSAMGAVGRALETLCVPEHTLGRLSESRYLVRLDSRTPPVAFAARVLSQFGSPLSVCGQQVLAEVAVGLAVARPDLNDGCTMVDDALAGLHEAQDAGTGYAFRPTASLPRESVCTTAALHSAIASDEIEVHYQPTFFAGTLRLRGAEALVRWRDGDGAWIRPDAFVPLAESSGLIGLLGERVLQRAVADWVRAYGPSGGGYKLSVNVAAQQLRDPWFAEGVLAILEEAGLDPAALELEVTERSVLEGLDRAQTTMQRLRKSGVSFALDDFGTGYSSLGVIAELPFSIVKLDKSLIASLPDSPKQQAIVRAAVGMAADLGLELVAEGIETPAQLSAIRELGCGLAQGFLLARPADTLTGLAVSYAKAV